MALNSQIFAKAEKLETLCADIYLALSLRFAKGERARDLFQRLHQEETQHAYRIRSLAGHYQRSKLEFSGLPTSDGSVDELIQALEGGLVKVKSSVPITPEEAYQIAARLEDRLALFHAQVMAEATDASVRQFFEMLAAQDRGHVELLTGVR